MQWHKVLCSSLFLPECWLVRRCGKMHLIFASLGDVCACPAPYLSAALRKCAPSPPSLSYFPFLLPLDPHAFIRGPDTLLFPLKSDGTPPPDLIIAADTVVEIQVSRLWANRCLGIVPSQHCSGTTTDTAAAAAAAAAAATAVAVVEAAAACHLLLPHHQLDVCVC